MRHNKKRKSRPWREPLEESNQSEFSTDVIENIEELAEHLWREELRHKVKKERGVPWSEAGEGIQELWRFYANVSYIFWEDFFRRLKKPE